IAVYAWQETVGHLHDRHSAAQSRINATHLQTDVAAADDEQRGRHFFYLESACRIHQPGALEVHTLQLDWQGARGQDGVLELYAGRRAVAEGFHAQVPRVLEGGSPVDNLNTGALAHANDALGKLICDTTLPCA